MKLMLLLSLMVFSLLASADTSECHKLITQSDKSECMAYQRDLAIGRFMTKVTTHCSEQSQVRDSLGGSIYPMLLDECMTRKIDELLKLVEED